MKPHFLKERHASTAHITLNTRACKACWQCIDVCPNGVCGKVDMPFHHHCAIREPEKCTGCLNCVSACPEQAISIKESSD